jgi:hypothetical protein
MPHIKYQEFKPITTPLEEPSNGISGDVLKQYAPFYHGPRHLELPSDDNGEWNLRRAKWRVVADEIFFLGVERSRYFLLPKPGIMSTEALRHILLIMHSREPSHNEKMVMCAFLLSLWFADVVPRISNGRYLSSIG